MKLAEELKYLKLEFESGCEPVNGKLDVTYRFINEGGADVSVKVFIQDNKIEEDIAANSEETGAFFLTVDNLPYLAEFKVEFQGETHVFLHEFSKPESPCVDEAGNPIKIGFGFGIPIR